MPPPSGVGQCYPSGLASTREDLTEKGHFSSSILNFETVAPLADECALLADCQMKLQYKLYVQLFIRY